jgi:energy-converting hydrogenase Eha subunit B
MLELDGLNYWAVLVAWLVFVVVGSFWYSPMGFGKLWTKLSGIDIMKLPKQEANMAIGYVIVSSLVQAFVLAVIINTIGATTATEGFVAGFVIWLGFTAATTVGMTFYSRKGWKYWWLNASFFLVTMVVNAVILAVWR